MKSRQRFGWESTYVSVTVIYFSDASEVKQTGVNSQLEIKHCDLGQVSSNWATSLFFGVFVCQKEREREHERQQAIPILRFNSLCSWRMRAQFVWQ